MKKILALLIIFSLSISLVACGGDKNAEEKKAVKTEQEEKSKEEPKEEKKTEEDKEEKNTEESEEPKKEEVKPAENKEEAVTITFGAPPAPPTLPLLHIMETKALGDNVDFKLDVWSDPETLIAMVQDQEHDIFAFPLTVIAKLHNKGMDLRLLNVNTWGVDYFLTTDPDFKTWADLKGKTLYIPLQSSPVDALAQYMINDAGLVPGEDVEIIYGSLVEIATLVASGEAEYAVLIEPQVSKVLMTNDKVRVALSLEEEWQRVTGGNTRKPTAGIGTHQSFIDAHPELIEDFQKAYEESVVWVNENPEEAGKLAEKYLGLKAPLIIKALPNMGLSYKSATDAKEDVEKFYNLLIDFNPKMVGGKLPDASMYYGK